MDGFRQKFIAIVLELGLEVPTVDITVLGGLPVTIDFDIAGPDPDVGIMSAYCDGFMITHINHRKCKKYPNWLHDKIEKNTKEHERVLELLSTYCEERDYEYN